MLCSTNPLTNAASINSIDKTGSSHALSSQSLAETKETKSRSRSTKRKKSSPSSHNNNYAKTNNNDVFLTNESQNKNGSTAGLSDTDTSVYHTVSSLELCPPAGSSVNFNNFESSSDSGSSSSASSTSSSSFASTNSSIATNVNKTDTDNHIITRTQRAATTSNISPVKLSVSNINGSTVSLHSSSIDLTSSKNLQGNNMNRLIQASVPQSSNLLSSHTRLNTISSDNLNNSPETFRKTVFSSLKESTYKKQKENYLTEKKRITNDMLTIMRDESIIVLADWLKIRASLKNWIKLYCILKPGIMLLFKSDKMKPGHWVGTIILNSCQLLERPSKKHGFCFKLFHPLERSIWASKGPAGENHINVPYMLLPTFYLIFRAPSEEIGNIWMESIDLILKSNRLLEQTPMTTNYLLNNSFGSQRSNNSCLNESIKSTKSSSVVSSSQPDNGVIVEGVVKNSINFMSKSSVNLSKSSSQKQTSIKTASTIGSNLSNSESVVNEIGNKKICNSEDEKTVLFIDSDAAGNKNNIQEFESISGSTQSLTHSKETSTSETDVNNHNEFVNDEKDVHNDKRIKLKSADRKDKIRKTSSSKENHRDKSNSPENKIVETKYVASPEEVFGELGNKGQTEEVGEENKSLIYCLVKQVRPGMDLSKVALPTFILEPRSFLEKLTDYYYHSDILTETTNNDDPYERMKTVVKFYLSGFYKKPKGLKKPYNPILGEVFRSYWYNPRTNSKTFYIAEQVSHHPPITSFYVSNRKEGFCIYGTILARSKFYGNSVSAIMDGTVKLVLLNRGEEYIISLPYANCKGILIGKLTMELGGKVTITCPKTRYSAEIEFKLKPLLGGIEASNLIEGKIKYANETISTLHGKWDGEIVLNEKKFEQKQVILWSPSKSIIEKRLKRFIVPLDEQKEFESERLWLRVSQAINNLDQTLATEEKIKIELKQREEEAERRSKFLEYRSKFFSYDNNTKEWLYFYADMRPWDERNDTYQYESDFKIITKTKHDLQSDTRVLNESSNPLLLISRTPQIVVSNVSEINEAPPNESYDLLVQYNYIKQRLDLIENNLKNISETINFSGHIAERGINEIKLKSNLSTSSLSSCLLDSNSNRNNNYKNQFNFKNLIEKSNLSIILNTKNIFVLIIAWLIGIVTAFLYQRLIYS